MATMLKLNPSDQGRRISLEEFLASPAEDAHHDDLIDGKLYVSLKPNPPQDWIEQWLVNKLRTFSLKHSAIINYVTNKARIFVPGRPEDTCPEPDLAAYTRYPLHRPIRLIRWEEVSPILVGEVLSEEDPDKDLVRNVEPLPGGAVHPGVLDCVRARRSRAADIACASPPRQELAHP
jgi:Uma2 family endonuclease